MSDWAAWSVKAADIGWDFQWLRLARWPWFEKHKCRMPFCEWQFCSHFFTIPACDKFEVDREWILNASTSASIDTIYLKNILSFLLNSTVSAKLHTDNSANKQIACKLETSRLCRVSGRLLRMQGKNCSSWNNMESLRCWNKVVGARAPFHCDGERVGEEQFLKQKHLEFSRRSIKMIKGMYGSSTIPQVAEGSAMPSSYSSILARHILQVSILSVAGALP